MQRRKKTKGVLLAAAIATITIAGLTPVVAASPIFAEPCGEEYVVQSNDWLSKLAEKYLGDVSAYPQIVEATNLVSL